MSKPRTYKGYVKVTELPLTGMITLRGDLGDAALAKAVKTATGQAVPAQRQISEGSKGAVAWMSPDELLIMTDYDGVERRVALITKTLTGTHHLAVNVSDARAIFELKGKATREIIAKLAPVDMAPAQFGVVDFRRSRFAQVPGAFWMPTETSARIICFRSVAQYMFDLLKDAAEPGAEVGIFN